jgi:MFS family permease
MSTNSPSHPEPSTQAVGPALDRLPWRPIHTRITLALGIGWMLDAFEVTIVGNVLGILQKLWDVTTEQASLLVSVWLIGIMIGALLFGYLADRFGRRKLFILTLLLYSTFTVLSALSPGYYTFLCFRFLTAIGVGAEYSAINAAIGELIPARYRGRASATVMSFWPLGAILAGIISLYFISSLPASIGWRLAFGFGAVIALFTIWVRLVLPESPRWLARRGRQEEAIAVSSLIAADAARFGREVTRPLQPTERAAGFFRQIKELARHHPGRLALGCALDFSASAGYYGLFALLPLVVLPQVHVADEEVPLFFIIGNIGGVVGGLIAAVGLDKFGRKFTVMGFYAFATLSMLDMGRATISGSASSVLFAFTVANLCTNGSWIAAYSTFSEVFPTSMRATGIGFSVAFGRIGAAIAPPLLVGVAQHLSIISAFSIIATFWALGAVAMVPWSFWGPEGRGQSLEALGSD